METEMTNTVANVVAERFDPEENRGYGNGFVWRVVDKGREYRNTGQDYPVGMINYRQYIYGEAYRAFAYTVFPSKISLGGYPTLAEAVKAIEKAYDNQ